MLLKVLCLLWQSQIMHYRLQTLSYLISICNPVRANEIKMNFNQVYMIFICFVHWSFSVSIPYWSRPDSFRPGGIILQLYTRFSSCICSVLGHPLRWDHWNQRPVKENPRLSVFRGQPSCPQSWPPEILSQKRGISRFPK